MEMKKIEAETLEEAYSKAAKELSCSVTEINYEIIQHPTTGMMGLFKKPAIIIAVKKVTASTSDTKEVTKESVIEKNSSITVTPKKKTQADSGKKLDNEKKELKKAAETKEVETTEEKSTKDNFTRASSVIENDDIVDVFFNNEEKKEVEKTSIKKDDTNKTAVSDKSEAVEEDSVESLEFDDDRDSPENRERSIEIENKLKVLIAAGCFEIDTVEVDVFNGIAHIFVDGEDAALLIGKEGYRYNALSYMLFNWINSAYDLYIKLEIAEFIQTQEEMIDNYLKPIAEHIIEHGRGKTKPLDGILVQIALEKLRAMFPNKYIAIKTGKDGKKFILINNFNSQKNN
jgi:spoIIIJ-associated protein